MSLNTASFPGRRPRFRLPFGNYSHASQPLGVGIVAILIISAAILFLGDTQVERSVLRTAGAEHESDLLRFSETLHYSGLSLNGPQAGQDLPELAQTAIFDTRVKRALFGLNAERMEIYALDGVPVYSTEGIENAPALSGGALEAFENASRSQFTSFFRSRASSLADFRSDAELIQSFMLMRDVPPGSVDSGRSLMVAAITSDVSPELDAAYATMWLVVGVFFFGSLVILAVVHWVSVRSSSRLKAANDALAMQNLAVRESRERMIAAADATKRAIAEELHGSVQTRLFSIWMRLSNLKKRMDGAAGTDVDSGAGPGSERAIRSELARIIDELDDVRENDIRGLSHRLHPSIVRVGAAPALKSLCDRLSGDVKVVLHADRAVRELEPPGASPIPEPVRLAVFRIAELAIGNTIKHAAATRCDVRWSYSESRQALVLSVEDDGVGFEQGTMSSSGLGMVNIQDYTDAIDGKAELRSEPDWGTTLTVTIPFVPVQAAEFHSLAGARLRLPDNVTPFEQGDQQAAA